MVAMRVLDHPKDGAFDEAEFALVRLAGEDSMIACPDQLTPTASDFGSRHISLVITRRSAPCSVYGGYVTAGSMRGLW